MTFFLFLDTIYVDGTEASNIFKDYLIPIITGIAIPFAIFLFTVWNEHFKQKMQNYNLREALYFKNEEILSNISEFSNKIEENEKSATFENNMVTQYAISKKNIEDVLQLPFERLVETFHNSLYSSPSFKNKFSQYMNKLIDVVEIISDYKEIILVNNEDNLQLNNQSYNLMRDITLYTNKRYYDYMDPSTGLGHTYWTQINNFVHNIKESNNKEDIVINTENLIEYMETQIEPDYFPENLYEMSSNLLVKLNCIKLNIDDLKKQFKLMRKQLKQSAEAVEDIQPSIRTSAPNKLHFWKYFQPN
ncbi:hypothetical protein [Sphingobacterium sp.]|uniref:hypothetical protein n=1 Tax=Sphingobacterium sp. TaxID=341027 RepID=UPI00289EA916|nr:hypothetical protein [Sphingobacterium sp.]